MGHVVKQTVMRWCRTDTLAQVRDPERIEQLKQKEMLVQRKGIGILIYLEDDFSDFYTKHAYRALARPDPVIVKNLKEIPAPREVRALVETALRIAVPGKAGGLEAPLPQFEGGPRYDIRVWNPKTKDFADAGPIQKQVFRFRDMATPASYNQLTAALRDPSGRWHLPKHEAETITSMYEEAFQKTPMRDPKTGELRYVPKMEYTIDYVWVIQKILIYRYDWHGA